MRGGICKKFPYRSVFQGSAQLRNVIDRTPYLRNQALVGHIKTAHVQNVVYGLHLLDLDDPGVDRLWSPDEDLSQVILCPMKHLDAVTETKNGTFTNFCLLIQHYRKHVFPSSNWEACVTFSSGLLFIMCYNFISVTAGLKTLPHDSVKTMLTEKLICKSQKQLASTFSKYRISKLICSFKIEEQKYIKPTVCRSWMRVLNPSTTSFLSSLLLGYGYKWQW